MIRPEIGLATSTGLSIFSMVALFMGARLKISVDKVYECFCKVISTLDENQCEKALDFMFYKNYSVSNVTELCNDELPFKNWLSNTIMIVSACALVLFVAIFVKCYRALPNQRADPVLIKDF